MIMVISILLLTHRSAMARETPDAETIIQRFIARAKAAAEVEARQMISYQRRTRIEELDDDDSVKETRSKEYAVTNRAGLVQTVLIKVNDRPPSDDELKSDRRTESDARRESGRRRRGPDFLDEALVRRFEYTLEGEETIEGRRVFRLAYQPTRTTTAGKDVDRILSLLHGQIWIDAEEYEMVKVEARLRSALRICHRPTPDRTRPLGQCAAHHPRRGPEIAQFLPRPGAGGSGRVPHPAHHGGGTLSVRNRARMGRKAGCARKSSRSGSLCNDCTSSKPSSNALDNSAAACSNWRFRLREQARL
jgi:hypothetical protein